MDLGKMTGRAIGGAIGGPVGAAVVGERLSHNPNEHRESHGLRNGVILVGVGALAATVISYGVNNGTISPGGIGAHENSPPIVGHNQARIEDMYLNPDLPLATVVGTSDASFGISAQACLPGASVRVPLLMDNAIQIGGQCTDIPFWNVSGTAHTRGNLDLMLSGTKEEHYGVNLSRVMVNGNDTIVATVDESKLKFSISEEANPHTTGNTGGPLLVMEAAGFGQISVRDKTVGIARDSFEAKCAIPLVELNAAGVAERVRETIDIAKGLLGTTPTDSPQLKANNDATLAFYNQLEEQPVVVIKQGDIVMPGAQGAIDKTSTIQSQYADSTFVHVTLSAESGCDSSPEVLKKNAALLNGEGTKYVIGSNAPTNSKGSLNKSTTPAPTTAIGHP